MRNTLLIDRIIRVILGLALIYFSKGSFDIYSILALMLLATAFIGYCPTYAFLGINREFAKKNNFLVHLPMYNPEPVFIFCPKGSIVFRNNSAKKILPKIAQFSDISESTPKQIIQQGSSFSVKYPYQDKIYMLEAIGIKEKKYILTYGFNITEIEKNRKTLKNQLITDSLTGLENRKKLITDISDNTSSSLILMVFDIIKFSQINTLFGHDRGDLFLQNFAKALLAVKDESKKVYSVYRLRGNTFALLLKCPENNILDKEYVVSIIQKRLEYLLFKFSEKSDNLSSTIDIRMGLSSNVGIKENSAYSLLNQAETALLEAKKNSLHVLDFDSIEGINERYKENLHWVSKLKAIFLNQSEAKLCTHFQPIFNLQTNKVEKYESLVRIEEKGEIISPFVFLEVAKQIEVLPDITKHVLKDALEIFASSEYEFSINITMQDLSSPQFPIDLQKSCEAYSVSANRVVLEILEDEDIYQYTETITQLKAKGFKIAIDDFGIGYSNFKKLQLLNVDYIKIDGSLIKNIAKEEKDLFVINSICTYAKAIGVKTIAEFVADEAIFNLLKNTGIDYMQGYFIGAPKAKPEEGFHV